MRKVALEPDYGNHYMEVDSPGVVPVKEYDEIYGSSHINEGGTAKLIFALLTGAIFYSLNCERTVKCTRDK